jgi:NAD(P)-dependent dehydrogenase (short-subunit alcohol dehydrogenase family)
MTGTGGRRFDGRVAWITGGGHGIGAASARRIAAEGGLVGVLALREETARAVAAECERLGGRAVATWGDAGEASVLEASHAEVVASLGPVDVLVNNVAIALSSRLDESTDDHWDRVYDVNFRAAVRCARLVIPGMRLRRGGVIVNVGSNHGTRGFPAWGAYASAKGALLALTRQQAVELAPDGIRVVSVTPGVTLTEMNEKRFAESPDAEALRAEFVAGVPMRRLARPDEIANGIAFVASHEASFMTGADLLIDGGESIQGG